MTVNQKTWTGLVTRGDRYRVSSDEEKEYGDVLIGGIDWLPDALDWITDTIEPESPNGRSITVAIGTEEFIGEPNAEAGWGYSEFTEVDPDKFELWATGQTQTSSHDILWLLSQREGEVVTLSLSYGAINMQEMRDNAAKVANLVSRNPDLPKLRLRHLDYTKERLEYLRAGNVTGNSLKSSSGKPIMRTRVVES